jgi:transcriptional regulator with XRE-family HTH domain
MPNGHARVLTPLPQRELQELSGVAKATIIRLENGGPAATGTIAKLAKALGITREQLVREDPAQAKHEGAA